MWLFTKHGFYSVVRARKAPGAIKLSKDTLMIRARRKGHLKALRRRFNALKRAKIHKDTHTDYRYRIFVAQGVWTKIATKLAAEIDYGNFKDTLKDSPRYAMAASQVWHVMFDLQIADELDDYESSDSWLFDRIDELRGEDETDES